MYSTGLASIERGAFVVPCGTMAPTRTLIMGNAGMDERGQVNGIFGAQWDAADGRRLFPGLCIA